MRLRFDTAGDVFTAFPTLAGDVMCGPSPAPPLAYMQDLLTGPTPEDALSFFAYLAPRREAVWWACRSIRAVPVVLEVPAALDLAEAWLAHPQEDERHAALVLAEGAPGGAPETWAAYGAGWSGGNIAPGGPVPVAAAPHLTAKAVRAAVLISVALGPAKDRRQRLKVCYDEALAVVDDDIDAHFR